ncbi:hypothetical protein BKA70DRAFT_1231978 [Coprinopsis sp. MPI-PUGE-AT-0042]|nr:hypothetical protein BKA70DRAFT_1231978 [Coprinopsis sp. MPI-PUGE-AT-0042]
MPKESVASSTRVTRSRSSTPVTFNKLNYRQIKNPQSLRLARGRRHPEGEPEAATTRALALDISSSSDGETRGFRIVSDAPKVDGPSETSMEEEEVVGSVGGRSDSGTLAEPSDLALVVMNASIERQNRQLRLKTGALGRRNKEIKALKERIAELDEEVEDKQSMLDESQKNEVQYRNWWLNEIQFTKLLLNKVPNPNRDIDQLVAQHGLPDLTSIRSHFGIRTGMSSWFEGQLSNQAVPCFFYYLPGFRGATFKLSAYAMGSSLSKIPAQMALPTGGVQAGDTNSPGVCVGDLWDSMALDMQESLILSLSSPGSQGSCLRSVMKTFEDFGLPPARTLDVMRQCRGYMSGSGVLARRPQTPHKRQLTPKDLDVFIPLKYSEVFKNFLLEASRERHLCREVDLQSPNGVCDGSKSHPLNGSSSSTRAFSR